MKLILIDHISDSAELSEGLAFLNIGQSAVSHGIDINSSVIDHSRNCCDRWFKSFEGTINEEILTYCPRDWFQVIKLDKLIIEEELKAERMLRIEAQEKLRIAEREREIYR
eukprot:gene38150-51522_t